MPAAKRPSAKRPKPPSQAAVSTGDSLLERRLADEGRAILDVDAKKIDETEYRDRLDLSFGDERFQILKASIERDGLQLPIGLRKKGRRYEIAWGHRRVRVCKELGIPVPARIVTPKDDAELVRLMFIENELRDPVSTFERALSVLDLTERKVMTAAAMCDLTGWKKSQVSNYRRLARFPEELLKLIPDPREIKMDAGLELIAIWEREPAKTRKAVISTLKKNGDEGFAAVDRTVRSMLTRSGAGKQPPKDFAVMGTHFATMTSQRAQPIVRFAKTVDRELVEELFAELAAKYEERLRKAAR